MAAKDLLDRIIFPRSRNQKVVELDEAWIFDFADQQLYVNGVEVAVGGGMTAEGARDVVAGVLVAGDNITIDVDDLGDTITIAAETDAGHDHDDDYVQLTGNETIAGVKTFSSDPLIPDEAYGVGWNGSLEPPTKNAVYDKIEAVTTATVVIPVGDGTNVIPTGIWTDFQMPFAGTWTAWRILATKFTSGTTGSIVFDLWGDSFANFPPLVGDSRSTSKPTLTAAASAQDTTITDWTEAFAAGDIFRLNVDSASTVTLCSLILEYSRSS